MPNNNWYPGKWYLEMIGEIFRLVAWPFKALYRLGKTILEKVYNEQTGNRL